MHNKLKQPLAVVAVLISAVVFSITFSALKFGPEKSDLNFNVTNVHATYTKPQIFQTLVESYGVIEPTHTIPIPSLTAGNVVWVAGPLETSDWFEEGAVIAKVSTEQALIDIQAPCDGLLMNQGPIVGQALRAGELFVSFSCSDRYQASVNVPEIDRHWLFDEHAQLRHTTAYLGEHQANVIGVITDDDSARLLLSFEDPLSGLTPLVLGSFVQPLIEGQTLDGVYQLPAQALRSNNQLWLEQDGQLQMVQVRIINREADEVWVLLDSHNYDSADINVVISSVSEPHTGMRVQVEQQV